MAKPIHSMIRVLDEVRSIAFYRRAFGLEVVGQYVFDGFTLFYLRNKESTFELELTVNHGRAEPYDLGDGYGHLAFSVANIEVEHKRLTEEGLSPTPVKNMLHDGASLASFFFVQDPDGYKIEVLQRAGRYE